MNNILSLVKNVFYKIQNPKKTIYVICCITAVLLMLSTVTVFKEIDKLYRFAFIAISIITPFIPYFAKLINTFLEKNFTFFSNSTKTTFIVFILSAITLVILTGIAIPTTLIESETELYCYIDNYKSPLYFMFVTLEKAIGFFILWPLCFFFLFSTNTKKALTLIFSSLAICRLINTFCFSGNYGAIETTLLFMEPQHFFPNLKVLCLNLSAIVLVIIVLIILLNKRYKIINYLFVIIIFSLSFISLININSIQNTFAKLPVPVEKNDIDPVFHLSKDKKNVIFIMSDACVTTILPEVFNDSPEVKTMFNGFTYYPNTVSLGKVTMLGSPGLYEGYEYTPHSMINYPEKTLQQKQNEALLTIPVMLHKEGYDVTVSDLL